MDYDGTAAIRSWNAVSYRRSVYQPKAVKGSHKCVPPVGIRTVLGARELKKLWQNGFSKFGKNRAEKQLRRENVQWTRCS